MRFAFSASRSPGFFGMERNAMIRLSIIMPTNRDNLTAISRIAQACSWAGPHTEVIIRDNSGSESKRRMLAHIEKENCHIITSDPCGANENWGQALGQAKGDFVYTVSDDDLFFDRAIAELPARIEKLRDDASVIGISAIKLAEGVQGSSVVSYSNVESGDPLTRLSGFLGKPQPHLIMHSPIRREVVNWSTENLRSRPFWFSFDDILASLLYLLRGKFAQFNRLIFVYDMHQWEVYETAQREDLKYYTAASLDPAMNKLHWFLCAFEGALLIRNLALTPDYSLDRRQAMADYWFATMFKRFALREREGFGSPLSADADKLCAKLKGASGQLTFEAMLADICQFLALKSSDDAMRYFAFWGNMLGLRQAPAA